jgi:uncharacterized protein (TIGR02646 family)
MKKINKGQQAQALMQWRAANVDTPQNLKYNQGGFPRERVLEGLLRDQGYLCAYTLKRISVESSHIEHIKPQCCCEAEDRDRVKNGQACTYEDIAWQNMVACFPRPGAPQPEYGAVVKGKWWDPYLFVSPLSQNCEQRFRYLKDGSVEAAVAGDMAVNQTINRLKLDNPKLAELRRQAILAAGIHPKAQNAITSQAVVRRLIQGWQQRYADQSFTEFCTAMIQAAEQHLIWIQRLSQCRAHAKGA